MQQPQALMRHWIHNIDCCRFSSWLKNSLYTLTFESQVKRCFRNRWTMIIDGGAQTFKMEKIPVSMLRYNYLLCILNWILNSPRVGRRQKIGKISTSHKWMRYEPVRSLRSKQKNGLGKYKHRALRLTFDTISSVAKTNNGWKKKKTDRFLNHTSAANIIMINKLCRQVNKKNAK